MVIEKSMFMMNVRNRVYFISLIFLWPKRNLLETDLNIEYLFLLMLNNVIYVILINMHSIFIIDMYAKIIDKNIII